MNSGMEVAAEKISSVNDNVMKSHYHDFFELFYLNAGERTVVAGSSSYLLKKGGLIIFPPYTMHHSYSSAGVAFSRTVVYFRESALPRGICDVVGRSVLPMVIAGREKSLEFERLLSEILEECAAKAAFGGAMLQSMASRLLIFMLRNRKEEAVVVNGGRMPEVVRYIQGHYSEKMDLDDLAARFFISKFHLCREFRAYTNCSVGEYIRKMRVLHALRMFHESDLSVTAIAEASGFSSLASFERVFKKYGGGRPKQESLRIRSARKGAG